MRKPAKSFQDLEAWKAAHQFVMGVSKKTEEFPNEEKFGLTSQIRRAAVSIPANIAEGFSKRGKKDKCRYFNISQGSLEECRYYLILATDLELGDFGNLFQELDRTAKLLSRYMTTIQDSNS